MIMGDINRLFRLKKFLSEEIEKSSPQEILDSVEAFIECFETLSDKQKHFIFNIWGNLEEIYAFALSEGRENMLKEEQKDFNELLQTLLTFTEELLQQVPDHQQRGKR